jgi:hypothetical protein
MYVHNNVCLCQQKDSRLDELENRISEQLEEIDSKDDAIDRLREGLADQVKLLSSF